MTPVSKNKAQASCMSSAMIVPAKSVEIFSPHRALLAQPAVEHALSFFNHCGLSRFDW
jgi:hypothetical protein